MGFELLSKEKGGRTLETNNIAVNNSSVYLGKDMYSDFKSGDYLMILIDYEKKKIAFAKAEDSMKGYKIMNDKRKPNASMHIAPKTLCKIIPKKKYKIVKKGNLWIFNVPEIARESK